MRNTFQLKRQPLASSGPALRTSLSGRAVLLPGDDVEAYDRHIQRFAADFQPSGDRETELVQSLADAQWRLNRIPVLEAGIYALAHIEMSDLFPGEPAAVRHSLIQARAYLAHTRQINNLHLQENRLRRHYAKDLAELRSLQSERESRQMASNFHSQAAAVSDGQPLSSQAAAPSRVRPASAGPSPELASNFPPAPSVPQPSPQRACAAAGLHAAGLEESCE